MRRVRAANFPHRSFLVSPPLISVCQNAAFVSHRLSSWVGIRNRNIQPFKGHGPSVPPTINMTYLGSTARVQQTQTLDLCLLPVYPPKKQEKTPKSRGKSKLFVKWLQSESEALFHLIYNYIYNTANVHVCICKQTFFVPLNLIGCHARKESSRFSCFRTLFGTHPQEVTARNEEKCTFVAVKVVLGAVSSPGAAGRSRMADISTLEDRNKVETVGFRPEQTTTQTGKKQIL